MHKTSGLAAVHAAVFLFGAVGLFAELIHLPAPAIALGRVVFAAAALALAMAWLRTPLSVGRGRDLGGFALAGGLLAFHWVAFFQSIQMSSVAIGLLTVSTFPVFTVFLEPTIFRERIQPANALWALVCLAGIGLVAPGWGLPGVQHGAGGRVRRGIGAKGP